MNLDRYEKIDGREALKRLLNGEKLYTPPGICYYIDADTGTLWNAFGDKSGRTSERFNVMIENDWYIPKPFDVRQAMIERPNEWVGAYKNFEGKWFKVGFDTASMNAVVEQIEWDGNPFWQHGRARPSVLNECIPIEDVPEEATR